MKYSILLFSLMLLLGCIEHAPTSDVISQSDLDTLGLTPSYWDGPMDESAWDSIKFARETRRGDFGLPFPIDDYEYCYHMYKQKPQANVNLEMLLGTWYGYGHRYDPRRTLILNRDYTYSLSEEDAIDKDGEIIYGNPYEVESGKYTYDEAKNKITFKDVYSDKELTKCDFLMNENPHDRIAIVFSIVGDTLDLFENTGDCWPYYRKKLY